MHIETDPNVDFAGSINDQMETCGPMHSETDPNYDFAGGINYHMEICGALHRENTSHSRSWWWYSTAMQQTQ